MRFHWGHFPSRFRSEAISSPADLTFSAGSARLPEAMHSFFGVTAQTTDVDTQLRKMSPYFMVHAGLPPFLLLHGTADEQVPYQQSPRFCEALKAKGNRCVLYTVQGARHGMGQWEENSDQLEYKEKVVSWLKQTLRDGSLWSVAGPA